MKKFMVFPVAIVLVLLSVASSHATLLEGRQIGVEFLHPDISTTYKDYGLVTVGSGIEISEVNTIWYGNSMYLDLTDTTLRWTFVGIGSGFGPFEFSGFRFQDTLGNIPDIGSVTVNTALTDLSGFDASRISFDANNIYVNFQGLRWDYLPRTATVDLAPVPIPGAVYLFGSGLVALVGLARRKGVRA